MPQLPESFEKDYLELLKPFISEEQKKSRRNVLVSSFTVITIYLLEKSLTELNVFGVHLGGSNDYAVLILATLLITYWLAMYLAYSKRDDEIQQEQLHLLLKHVETIKARIAQLNKNIEECKTTEGIYSHYRTELDNEKNWLSIYEKQLSRTAKAGNLNFALKKVEYWLPFITGITALFVICKDIVQ
ncbi:MAG: hypothetical protein Q7U91_01770 [Sideroxyarcus sp.]|nr:hypothetical protein [Sideroxyarcus sp.]